MNKMVFLSNLTSFEITIKIDTTICLLKSHIFFKNHLNATFLVLTFHLSKLDSYCYCIIKYPQSNDYVNHYYFYQLQIKGCLVKNILNQCSIITLCAVLIIKMLPYFRCSETWSLQINDIRFSLSFCISIIYLSNLYAFRDHCSVQLYICVVCFVSRQKQTCGFPYGRNISFSLYHVIQNSIPETEIDPQSDRSSASLFSFFRNNQNKSCNLFTEYFAFHSMLHLKTDKHRLLWQLCFVTVLDL